MISLRHTLNLLLIAGLLLPAPGLAVILRRSASQPGYPSGRAFEVLAYGQESQAEIHRFDAPLEIEAVGANAVRPLWAAG